MASRSQQGPKKSAFSCEQCRKRKVKCGAEQPICLRCRDRHEVCEYKLHPTLLYTQRLEKRIKQLEGRLKSYEKPKSLEVIGASGLSGKAAEPGFSPNKDPSSENSSLPAVFEGLSVNQSGQVSFHGPTSFLNLALSPTAEASNDPSSPKHVLSTDIERSQQLVINAWQQRMLETLSSTPKAFQYLLNFHWTWIQPVFNFVYRPAFTRDMDVSGPYFSYALLAAILAHSARWRQQDAMMQEYLAPYENGALFARHARTLLHEDLRDGKCDIPTLQTCLLLSAGDCSKGNWTQAWMYSGVAFRLMEDQGINVDQRYSKSVVLSEEDTEIRKRLFWSCYLWDKVICLYLGRNPAIQRSHISPDHNMLDDSSETDLWTPDGIVFTDGREYPPWKAHSVSCFKWVCKLAEILNEVLSTVYNPLIRVPEMRLQECLGLQKRNLQRWRTELPESLYMDPTHMHVYCPPSHIVTLNSLYHTVNILLHRPLLSKHSPPQTNRAAVIECLSSSSTITMIFELFSATFGLGYSIMSLSYGLYMAASIFLLQIQAAKSPDPRMLERLYFCIYSLESISTVNPVLQQGLRVIRAQLDKLDLDHQGSATSQPPIPSLPTASEGERSHAQAFEAGNPNTSNIASNFAGFESLETMEFPQDMLEALANIEPIRANVGNERNIFDNYY